MVDLLAALVDRGCLHILFRVLANLDSWDLQVKIIITSWQPWKNGLKQWVGNKDKKTRSVEGQECANVSIYA